MGTKGRFEMVTDVKFRENDTVNVPISTYFNFDKEYVRFYFNQFKILFSLNKSEFMLLHYFATRMSNANIVLTNRKFKDYFLRDYKEATGETLSIPTVRNLIAGLVKHGLMVRVKIGKYRLNPFVVTKYTTNESEREKLMKRYLIETGKVKAVLTEEVNIIEDNEEDYIGEIPD